MTMTTINIIPIIITVISSKASKNHRTRAIVYISGNHRMSAHIMPLSNWEYGTMILVMIQALTGDISAGLGMLAGLPGLPGHVGGKKVKA